MSACSNGICEKKFYLLEYCEEWLDGPLIVDENTLIEIRICKKGKPGLSFDSHNTVPLQQGDRVAIRKTKSNLTLIHPEDHNFYNACRTKLGWSLGVPSKKLK